MVESNDDYYEMLGISPDADDEELRRVWRQLAMKWHPDRAGSDVTFIFQKLSKAYAVLSDPAARATYDRKRGIGRKVAPASPPPSRAPGVLIRRLSSPLEVLFACGAARRGDDGVIELVVDADEARDGGMITVAMDVAVRCPRCNGGGACAQCGGAGWIGDRFSAWLALRPGATDGTLLEPSVQLAGVIAPVRFRVRLGAPAGSGSTP